MDWGISLIVAKGVACGGGGWVVVVLLVVVVGGGDMEKNEAVSCCAV